MSLQGRARLPRCYNPRSLIVHNQRTIARPKRFRGQRDGFQTPGILARPRSSRNLEAVISTAAVSTVRSTPVVSLAVLKRSSKADIPFSAYGAGRCQGGLQRHFAVESGAGPVVLSAPRTLVPLAAWLPKSPCHPAGAQLLSSLRNRLGCGSSVLAAARRKNLFLTPISEVLCG